MNIRLKHFSYLFSMLAAASFMQSCANSDQTSTQIKAEPVAVTTALPQSITDRQFTISGKVESLQKAEISTRMMGYIIRINVKVGDKVSKGQLLAVIESSDIQARQAQAEAMLSEAEAAQANAQKDLDRFTSLHQQKSASDKELENVKLQYLSATARVEAARQMRNEAVAMKTYTNITAPFAGAVAQKYADAGAIANPGMPILSIEGDNGFQITASVPESEIASLGKNQQVEVTIPSANQSFSTVISEISHSSLQSGGQYLVRVSVPDSISNILSGQYATLAITAPLTNASKNTASVRVPIASIVTNDQLTGLYTISTANTALLRWVRLGKQFGDEVEVISGLAANEPFILSAAGKLWNGAPVAVRTN